MTMDLEVASNERHERFVARVIESGEVWVLQKGDVLGQSWATTTAFTAYEDEPEEELPIVPFWSDRAYAQRCAKDEWSSYKPVSIPLGLFIDRVLRDMHEKNVLVGTNWNGDLVGKELEAIELATQLDEAIQNADS